VQLERSLNTIPTSSMGRLFDAAAALAGVRQQVNYEAQAAMEFEAVLDQTETGAYPFNLQDGNVDVSPTISALITDIHAGKAISILSARFHNGLAKMARAVCDEIRKATGIEAVALSGGVWQNMSLLGLAIRGLREDGFTVYIHRQVPVNDGGLSLGQALVGATKLKYEE
jgi:hydrogenase maturation protein HypF